VVFGLRKFRHHLYGEKFEVITDHKALTWLLALRDSKERLARWIVEMHTFDFEVMYERDDGALMAVPDALSRDTMGKSVVLCHPCLEAVQDISEGGECAEGRDVLTVEELLAAQAEAYGDGNALLKDEDCIRDGEGLLCKVFGKQDVRVLVPQALRDKVLKLMHGNRVGGHWCVLRTAARLRSRYYWPGCSSDVREAVSRCLDCKLGRLEKPGLQARMVRSHPSRRFQIVAMDVLEMSPQTKRGNRKILVIGDVFSRFNVAVAIPDEKAETVARVSFDRWMSVFGPPELLLTDLRPNFTSGVITDTCRLVGTRKSFTSAYRPQTNGFVERYNRTLSTELSRSLLDEEDWDLSLWMVTFR
jgi:transposase InsO family protein